MALSKVAEDFISQVDFFKDFSKEEMALILKTSKERLLSSGQFVFKQKEKVGYFYLLRTGQVKLTRLSPDGNEKVIDIIQARRFFAEAVVFKNLDGYPVNAEVLEDSSVICIDCEVFRSILKSSPSLCFEVMANLATRLHFLIREVDRLTLHNASYRLIQYLLEQVEEGGASVNFSVPKHVIASRISVKPETLSRILKQLSQEGFILVKRKEIEILNIKALEDYIALF